MTDISPGLPGPSSTPISNPQIASARQSWIAAGLDPQRFDAGMAGPSPAVPAAPAVQAPSGPQGSTGLNAKEAVSIAQQLIASGMDRARVEASLRGEGFGDDVVGELGKSNAQTQIEAAFGGARPDQINVDWRSLGFGPETDTSVLAEMHQASTRWASDIGFPAAMAGSFIERAVQSSQTVAQLNGPAREAWMYQQTSDFAKAVGPENVATEMRFAALALSKGDKSFTDMLHKSGGLSEAGVVRMLALQGHRMASMQAS